MSPAFDTALTVHDIVKKLIGPVKAVGDHNDDQERLANLKAMSSLAAALLCEISEASRAADRQEASMREIGLFARAFLIEVKESLNEQ